MKKIFAVLLLLFVVLPAFAAQKIYTDIVTFDDSAAGNTITFSSSSLTFGASIVAIRNNSTKILYCRLGTGNPTADPHTDHVSIRVKASGDTFTWRSTKSQTYSTLTCICESGQSCTDIDIYAQE